jgi:23S rRNA pseudouridine2605 synthase
MQERLQKIIANHGITSRRRAEEILRQGRVTVNGVTAAIGDKADTETDDIKIDGKLLGKTPRKAYIMLYKPRGYVATRSDEKNRKTVMDLLSGVKENVYPAGRLDLNSEGMLLLTNDGDFAYRIMHPSHEIQKKYHVWVRTSDAAGTAAMLRQPMQLDDYRIHPAEVRVLKQEPGESVLEIIIHEGRNRQIRKMCEKAGVQVKRLKRVGEGQLFLGDLHPGQWKYLSESEAAKALQN